MDNEVVTLIKLFVKKTYLSLSDAQIETRSTKRQVLYRLEKINLQLKAADLPLILVGSDKEFILADKARTYLSEFVHTTNTDEIYYLNRKERQTYIYLMLFVNPEYLSLQHFIDTLQVSRSTVLLDIKDLQLELEVSGIQIENNRMQGYFLAGSEMSIRRYMMKLVLLSMADERNTKVFDLFIDSFRLDLFEYSRLVITELAAKHHISFVEDRLVEFIYIFIFLRARIISGKNALQEIELMPDLEMMKSLKEYTFTKELMKQYKNTQEIPELEVNYISSWILGISVGNVEEDSEDCLVIGEIVGKIMTRFELLSGVHYKDSEEIFRQLFSHFRPAYYRLLFKLPIFNPLCARVKEEYKELYSLVNETMKPFNILFGDEIIDDEIAYLTLHFATIYSRNRDQESLNKKQALIVCTNGIGSSAILYSELKGLFPEINFYLPIEAALYADFDQPVDIIFTTQYHRSMVDSRIPVIKVSAIMDMRERYEVAREVYGRLGTLSTAQPNVNTIMEIIRKHAVIDNETELYSELLTSLIPNANPSHEIHKENSIRLTQMTSPQIIQLNLKCSSWQEAIRLSGQCMVAEHKVTQDYVDAIIRINLNSAPYLVITKAVALPHARPELGALQRAIGIATLADPVAFGNQENDPVKYVFFLSALDNESHLCAMSELLELLNTVDFFAMLDHAASPEAVYDYIKKFELAYFKQDGYLGIS